MSKFTDLSGKSYICCENHIASLGQSTQAAQEEPAHIDDKCVKCDFQEWLCKYKDKKTEQKHVMQLCDWHYRVAFKGLCPTHKNPLSSAAPSVLEKILTQIGGQR